MNSAPDESLDTLDLEGLEDVGESDAFLRAAAHVSGVLPLPQFAREGAWIAGRYRLDGRLGRGGHGEVWDAHDRLSGERVALKILRPGTGELAARACREVASLRLLRLPGIVRLIDEGIEDEHPFVVMERAEGAPFPGVAVPCTWAALERPLVKLCEALARVHAVGLLHRDLKPGNVLVDGAGRPTILDFGLSCLSAATAERITGVGMIVGTAAYLAPEQIAELPLSARTDLYAVGVMAFHALTGRFPHASADLAELLRGKLTGRPPALASLVEGVPAHVAAVVDRLLATNSDERPRSAAEVAEVLRGGGASRTPSAVQAIIASDKPIEEADLRTLFAGPDRLLHLREDAARLLFSRTGGDPARIEQEIEAWTSAGLCRWDGDLLAMNREAIDALETPVRLASMLVAEGAPPALAIAEEAMASAAALAAEGRLARAVLHLEEGLRALRGFSEMPADIFERLLSQWVEIALTEGSPQGLDRALYELCRPGPGTELTRALERLVRVALAVNAWTERAAELAEGLPRLPDPRLERLRYGVRVLAARRVSLGREEAVLEEARAWALASGDRAAQAAHAAWLGRLRYCQNRFEEAARLEEEAAEGTPFRSTEIAARLDAASAWMEAFQLERAAAGAAAAAELARRFRLPMLEARAEWLRRCIDYRAGKTDGEGPDEELVEAASRLGSLHVEGLVSVAEAAVAYRKGDPEATRALAGRAFRCFSGTGHPLGRLVAGALLVAAGERLSGENVEAILAKARACPVPSVGIQVLALLAEGGVAVAVEEAALSEMASAVPAEHASCRLDVLSIEEALSRLLQRVGTLQSARIVS
ncbi:serine/threonine-protein kinase [Polyangium sp. 15x6]|uniref:serine/threonine-protein kinase n=1 Tax=Polyangium sp. 15x6 TaxID=3042687 RepID=UPI00249C3897|nr:serine/threonine-protein kinase [Polyangium sp. 15x6]MDI3289400.1 serine/threonine-protein kinase [Polyangium sp. 15x6]